MYNYTALFLNFTLEQYVVMESEGYVPVGVMLSGGRSTTPITVIVTPTEQSPISAMGKYVHIHTVPLRGNVALARENLLSKHYCSIEFRVLILQGTRRCKVTNTQNKLECTICHVRTYELYVIISVVNASRQVSYSTR